MRLEEIAGNERAKAYLRHMVAKQTVGNSLLFAGPEGVGKGLFARALSSLLIPGARIGIHPDIQLLRPEGKIGMHSIEAVRIFSDEVYSVPTMAKKRVFILHDAERMLPTSANALLKTFEEPALHAVIILLSSQPQALLPTIRSRCRQLIFQPIEKQEIARFLVEKQGCSSQEAEGLAHLSQGSMARALRLRGQEHQRQKLRSFLSGEEQNLTALLKEIVEPLEALKEKWELSLREEREHAELSAVQKEKIQKEVEGLVALRYREEVEDLFFFILAWYRDLHLLTSGIDPHYLFHAEALDALKASLVRQSPPSLFSVERAIGAAKIALERSTPLKNCLEAFFLNF